MNNSASIQPSYDGSGLVVTFHVLFKPSFVFNFLNLSNHLFFKTQKENEHCNHEFMRLQLK